MWLALFIAYLISQFLIEPSSYSTGAGKTEDVKDFFRTLYSFMYLVGTYLKPHVSDILY